MAVVENQTTNNTASLQFYTSAFEDGEEIPKKFHHIDGNDKPIPLTISSVPEGTETLVLTMIDEDTPNDYLVHWLIWNIDPDTKVIQDVEESRGKTIGLNSWKEASYRGPCPLMGRHHYTLTLYALDQSLNIPENTSYHDLLEHLKPYVIAKQSYTGWVETTDEFAIE